MWMIAVDDSCLKVLFLFDLGLERVEKSEEGEEETETYIHFGDR